MDTDANRNLSILHETRPIGLPSTNLEGQSARVVRRSFVMPYEKDSWIFLQDLRFYLLENSGNEGKFESGSRRNAE